MFLKYFADKNTSTCQDFFQRSLAFVSIPCGWAIVKARFGHQKNIKAEK